MFDVMTYKWADTLVALIAIAMIPIPYVGIFDFYRASLWTFYVPVLTLHDHADSFLLRVKDTTQQPRLPKDTGDRARTQVVN